MCQSAPDSDLERCERYLAYTRRKEIFSSPETIIKNEGNLYKHILLALTDKWSQRQVRIKISE